MTQRPRDTPAAEADNIEFLMYLLGWLAFFCFAAQFHLVL